MITSTEAAPSVIELAPIQKLTRDLRNAAATLTDHQARFLVDAYYTMQDNRIRADGQIRSMKDEPHETLDFFATQAEDLEGQMKRALDAYSNARPIGRWARSICGIGPVIAAGLMANIDIRRSPTAGHLWSYAGLNPKVEWEGRTKVEAWMAKECEGKRRVIDEAFVYRAAALYGRHPDRLLEAATRDWTTGESCKLTAKSLTSALCRRPWNASLKRLIWLCGESFVKVKGNENDYYGKIYDARKRYEQEKNERGEYAEQCVEILASKNFTNDTVARKAYMEGRLPDGHIHARAKRFAGKIFLSHYFDMAVRLELGKEPPRPYVIEHMGHVHMLNPPNMEQYLGKAA